MSRHCHPTPLFLLKILQSNKTSLLLLAIILLFSYSTICFFKDIIDPIDQWHSTTTIHGLYEIREEARKFIANQNSANHTKWVALDPNYKIIVPRCIVPLKAKWAPESHRFSQKSVLVYCIKSISTNNELKKWDVIIPVVLTKK